MRIAFRITTASAALLAAAFGVHAQTAPAPAPAPTPAPAAKPAAKPAEVTPIVVLGTRPKVVNKVDRKVYNVDQDLQGTTGSVSDVLKNIPSVEVDIDGTVALRGDTSVTILIDGKPASQLQGASKGDALQQIPAGDIAQVEIITSPSAEFKPDGSGGIINLVTRKNHKQGGSGLIQVNLGNDNRSNVNISGNMKTDTVDLGGGLGVRKDDRMRTADNVTTETDPVTSAATTTHETSRDHSRRIGTSGNVNLDYSPTDTQTFGVSVDYALRDAAHSSSQRDVSSGATTATSDRADTGKGRQTNGDAQLSFDQKLAHEGEDLSFTLQTGQELETTRDDTTTQTSAAPTAVLTRYVNQNLDNDSEFSATYVRPLASGSTLKLGYDEEYERTAFNNSVANANPATAPLIVDHSSDNLFRYRQTIQAVYATFDKKAGKLEWLGGLRFEQVENHTLQNVSGDRSTQSYGTLYPTLNVLYTLSDNDTLTMGYSKRVRRRDPEDLNPYINASDPNNLRQGNPKLKPELTDSLEVGYRHDADGASYSLTGYYRKSRNGDTEVLSVISPTVVLITEANLPSSQSGGVEFLASGKVLPKLSYTVSGNFFYNQVNAQALGTAGLRSAVALNTKAALDYAATAKDRWQVSVNYNGKRLTAQGYVLPVTVTNVGYRHQVNDTLAVVATVSDLFNSQKQKRLYQTPTFTGTYERQQGGQIAYLGLVYTLGAKKPKDSGFTYDQGG